jgi:alpha-mannosidase
MRLSLLRSPKVPDAQADMGEHRFRYALFPHENGPQLGGVIAEGAAFNQPLRAFRTSEDAQSRSFFGLNNPAVVLDTVKKAEDSDEIVVRLYESHGAHQQAVLRVPGRIRKAVRTNLLETDDRPVYTAKNEIKLSLRPFELVTLKLDFDR